MDPTTLAAVVGAAGTLFGAAIGFFGSYVAARVTARQNRLENEKATYGPILRKLHEIDRLLDDNPRHGVAQALHDEKLRDAIVEMEALALRLHKDDRDAIRECTLAVEDRSQYGPDPRRVGFQATTSIHEIVLKRANKNRRGKVEWPDWVEENLSYFREMSEVQKMNREENAKAMEEWLREQRKKPG